MVSDQELIDATDLDHWADRREAQDVLPRVVRSLLALTPGVTGVRARAGEGVVMPGWDGRADGGAGSAYVPAGPGVWEVSTGGKPRERAQENYRKRTANPL